nr:ATP-binding cassette domain-containing protein [Ktedonobacter robiniae]
MPPRSAYTPQVPQLFSDPLRENILLGWPEQPDRQSLDKAIATAVLELDIAALEQGLETLVGTCGVKLSGGQIQRTAAARMLVREAELLVFDDLSSALDIATEQLLWERLFSGGERTCLVVSHRPALLELANQVIVLKDGRVEATGPLSSLLETCEELQGIFNRI